jgi:hypothetical protein
MYFSGSIVTDSSKHGAVLIVIDSAIQLPEGFDGGWSHQRLTVKNVVIAS